METTMHDSETSDSVGGIPEDGARLKDRVQHLGQSARELVDEARGTIDQVGAWVDLKGRMERNPVGVLAASFGVGFILAGGLVSALSYRVLTLGVRLAAVPFIRRRVGEAIASAFETRDASSKGAAN